MRADEEKRTFMTGALAAVSTDKVVERQRS